MSIQGAAANPVRVPADPTAGVRVPVGTRPAGEPASPAATESRSLWELLTPEERTFFQQLATAGRLTYGPGARPDDGCTAAPTGGRIDVRG